MGLRHWGSLVSWQACNWADQLDYDVCGALPFRVLIKLANVAADDGSRAWRTKATMAKELGVSQRSVQRALKELEMAHLILRGDQSFVERIRADKRPTVYDLNLRYAVEYALPDLPLWDGETELSTSDSGETTTGLTGRQLLSHKERSINEENLSTRGNPGTRVGNTERSAHSLSAAEAASADPLEWCPNSPPRVHEWSHASNEKRCGWCGIRPDQWFDRKSMTVLQRDEATS